LRYKKLIITAAVLLAVILVPILLYFMGKSYFTHERAYELTWRINIPSGFKEKKHYTSEHGFHGDGIRFTIFNVIDMNPSLIMNSAGNVLNIETFAGSSPADKNDDVEKLVKSIISRLQVDEENAPRFDESYSWKLLIKDGNSRLVMLYFPKSNLAYFAEELR
jgi:hypothetical protein